MCNSCENVSETLAFRGVEVRDFGSLVFEAVHGLINVPVTCVDVPHHHFDGLVP